MSRVRGLMVISESVCDSCGREMKHLERYAYICEEGQPTVRFCVDCSREKGYLTRRKDDKGRDIETFLSLNYGNEFPPIVPPEESETDSLHQSSTQEE